MKQIFRGDHRAVKELRDEPYRFKMVESSNEDMD